MEPQRFITVFTTARHWPHPQLPALFPYIDVSCTSVYPKVSGLATWSENCKWYSCSCITILCYVSSVYCCCLFRYRPSPETFGYPLVHSLELREMISALLLLDACNITGRILLCKWNAMFRMHMYDNQCKNENINIMALMVKWWRQLISVLCRETRRCGFVLCILWKKKKSFEMNLYSRQ